MSHPFQLELDQQRAYLTEATARFVSAVITCKMTEGWTTLKSRFLGMDTRQRHLFVEYPSNPGAVVPEIVAGQNIGVSFRRGHKKCVFNSIVLGRCRMPLSAGREVPALTLEWPEEMCELQRRLYYRVSAPEGMAFPVQLWPGGGDRPAAGELARWGTIVDLSAGGISVALPGDNQPPWREDDIVTCAFAADPKDPPVVVAGRLRHWTTAGGGVRAGIHFVGLDSRPDLRDTFRRVVQTTALLQRAEIARQRRR